MGTPATLDISIYRGDDYVHQFTFMDNEDPPAPKDLTAYTFKAQIRDRPENGQILYAEFDIDTSQAEDGIIILSLPASVTTFSPGYWDLETDDGDNVQTWLKGTVNVSGDVTREVSV